MSEKPKPVILFLCTGNSCRSQMAHGFAHFYWQARYNIVSAGVEKHGLNPRAVKVMQEADIDISTHTSNTIDEIDLAPDVVVTVCGHADEVCPTFPSQVRKIHVPFDDPPKLAVNARSEEEALVFYRDVRDEIEAFIKELPDRL